MTTENWDSNELFLDLDIFDFCVTGMEAFGHSWGHEDIHDSIRSRSIIHYEHVAMIGLWIGAQLSRAAWSYGSVEKFPRPRREAGKRSPVESGRETVPRSQDTLASNPVLAEKHPSRCPQEFSKLWGSMQASPASISSGRNPGFVEDRSGRT